MSQKEEKQPLNICIISTHFPVTGRASKRGFLWPVARGLVQKGHKVTVLSWKNPNTENYLSKQGVEIYFLGNQKFQPLTKFPEMALEKFFELHQKTPFHLVHSIDSTGRLIAKRKKEFGVQITYDVNATEMAQIISILGMAQETLGSLLRTGIAVVYKFLTTYFGGDRSLLKKADGVFVTSPFQKIVLERYYLYPEYRTYLVPYGIELGDLNPKEQSEKLREDYNIPKNSHNIVTISDMTELEEIKTLLKAFEKVVVKKPSTRLIIIGNGPLRNQIEFEMLNLALGNKVIMTGTVSNKDLPDYIGLANVFVNLSARTSGFEPSILEAMAQEKVVIGSEVSPISTIVDSGTDGFLIRPADLQTLSSFLIQIFNDQIDSASIGKAARQKVLKLFEIDNMVTQTIDAFNQTIEKSKRFF